MPDQFGGDVAPNTNTTTTSHVDENPSILEQVKLGVASVAKSFTIDMWLARHTPVSISVAPADLKPGSHQVNARTMANLRTFLFQRRKCCQS